MAVIDTIFQETPEKLRALGRELQQTALDTGQSIQDVTTSTYEFLSAGIGRSASFIDKKGKQTQASLEQIAVATRAAANLAVGGLATQTEAVTALSFALNAYGLNQKRISSDTAKLAGVWKVGADGSRTLARNMGEAATVISDQFAKAVEIGVVTASQIARTFATVASSAKVAGIGIDEIAAAYASQTVRGVSAARVTVSMNRAIQDLIKPGKQLKSLMEDTGKNYANIARTKGIHVALQEMRNDAKATGVEFATLFKRQEGWRFALNITADDMKDKAGDYQLYIRTLEQIRDSEGSAAEQAKRRGDTVTRNFARVKIAWQIFTEAVGFPLLKPLNEALKAIIRLQVSLTDWARANEKIIEQMGPIVGFVASLLALTAGTQGLLFALQPIAPLLGTTATNLRGLALIIGRVAAPFAVLIGLLGSFKYLVENNVRGFGQFNQQLEDMKSLAAGVVNVFKTIGDSIRYVWDVIGQGGDVDKAVSASMDAIGQSVEDLGPTFERVAKFIAQFFLSIGTLVVSALAKAIPAIANWFVSVARAIAPKAAYLLGVFVGWASDVVPQIIENLGNLAREFGAWIQRAAPQILAALGYVLGAIVDWASEVVPNIINALGDIGAALVAWVRSVIPVVGRALGQLIENIRRFIETNGPGIIASFGAWAKGIADWFANDLFPQVQRGLSEFLKGVVSFLQDTQLVRRLVNFLVTAIAGIAALIASHAGEIADVFITIAQQAIAAFVDFFNAHGGELADAGLRAGGSVIGGLVDYIVKHPMEVVQALATVFLIAATAGALMNAVGFLGLKIRAVLGMTSSGGSIWGTGLTTALTGAFNIAKAGVLKAASFLGQLVGRAFSLAMAAGEVLAQALVYNLISLGGVLKGPAMSAGRAVGQIFGAAMAQAAMAWQIFQNYFQQTAIGQRLSGLFVRAGTAIGQMFGAAIAQAAFAWQIFQNGLQTLWQGSALQGAFQRVGMVLGRTFGSAVAAGAAAAIVAAPIAVLLVGIEITADLDRQTAALVNQAKEYAANATDAQIQQSIDGIQKELDGMTWQAFGSYDKVKSVLDELKAIQQQRASDAAHSLPDAIGNGVNLLDNPLNKLKGKVKSSTSGIRDMLVDPFKQGFNDINTLPEPFDWGKILGIPRAQGAAAQIKNTVTGTMEDLKSWLTRDTGSMNSVIEKYLNPKTHKVKKSSFTSDDDRIKAITGDIKDAQKALRAATKAKDSPAVIAIQDALEDLKTQRAALIKVRDEAKAAADKEKAERNKSLQKALPPQKLPLRKDFDSRPGVTSKVPTIPEPQVGDTGQTMPAYLASLSGDIASFNSAPKAIAFTTTIDGTSQTPAAYAATTAASFGTITTAATTANTTVTNTLGSLPVVAGATGAATSNALGANLGATTGPVLAGAQAVTATVKTELNNANTSASNLGISSALSFAKGITDNVGAVTTALTAIVNAVRSALAGLSWYSYGTSLVASFIKGMRDMIPSVEKASLAVAHAASKYQRAGSPPKEGPNRAIVRWGHELVNQYAIGMVSAFGLVQAASLAMAESFVKPPAMALGTPSAAVAVAPPVREVAPMSMGWRGGGGEASYGSSIDRDAQARQLEMLAEIASATRLGAAASARGASRDPRAGGPLAARSHLVALKQMTTSRARGGA